MATSWNLNVELLEIIKNPPREFLDSLRGFIISFLGSSTSSYYASEVLKFSCRIYLAPK